MASDLDRVDQHRASSEWVANLWRAEDAKLLKLDANSRFTTNVGGSKLRMTKPFVEFDSQRHRLLGLLNGSPIFAVEALTEGEVHDFREVGALLTDNERDVAATASALTQWHRAEPRCPACGERTLVINGGFARHCPTCGHDHFPRTDPAVIVAVLDAQDRILLGSQSTWPARRVSVLAGFVEVGESLEQAIHREIAEEVDVTLSSVHYFGSQPWPFPRSLMLGFAARASSTDICVDGQEIEFAAWFSRDEVHNQVASGELGLPGETSIAYRLIEAWLQDELPV
ncbi:MAG: diphosphatase [Actinomycetota bacterium]|jgi:NAD+ diphosphatase|nr:diphosphatase [Actinomycetota bacterium]